MYGKGKATELLIGPIVYFTVDMDADCFSLPWQSAQPGRHGREIDPGVFPLLDTGVFLCPLFTRLEGILLLS